MKQSEQTWGDIVKKRVLVVVALFAVALVVPSAVVAEGPHPMLVQINAELESAGADFRVEMAEYITTGAGGQFGQTIYAFNRGNKQLSAHFVPGDPRRGGATDITWLVDGVNVTADGGLTPTQVFDAIDRAMATWQNELCSDIPLTGFGPYPYDFGYVQYLYGFGGMPAFYADVTHAGWLPAGFFNAIAPPNGSASILGVTFTFVWVEDGEPTDIDGNGKSDVAFREIYYNDRFGWKVNGTYDIETIALHEFGHGLSQAHFGAIFATTSNAKLHFSPRAVMNAAYSGIQQQLTGTDTGGHCSIWAHWPNN